MRSQTVLAILACFLLLPAAVNARSLCVKSYADGIAPKITNEKVGANTREICYEGYAVMFSGASRTPLWSAEYLTKYRVNLACALNRYHLFHPDPNLPLDVRSELSDYARSGFDRGHMAPSRDMPTLTAQEESFSLANMAPQLHANNAGIWERLENGTRNLALSGHDVYVVSGPLFEGAEIKQLKAKIMIPTGFYKAIYDATTGQAGVFITPNTEEQAPTVISIDDLAERTGIDVFPELPSEVKSLKTAVITPAKRTDCVSMR